MIRAGYIDEGIGFARASLTLQPEQPELHDLLREIAERRPTRRGGALAKILRSLGMSSQKN